jgi:DNA polymerase-4
MSQRKIIHIDMDAFFASVEQRDNPELRGKPVAVGGSSSRGVVAAASYEARAFGVRSAMPSSLAARKCADLIFVRPRFDAYKEASNHIRSIFHRYTDLVEPLSLDEAYLDVTQNKMGLESATQIARNIRKEIYDELNLTASAGVSVNKFLAKVASDLNKPNGISLIRPEQVDAFSANLKIEKFFGIGEVTAKKMHRMGIHTGNDLRRFSRAALTHMFGKAGGYFYNICRGIDDREVKPDRVRKSVGAEQTFKTDLADFDSQCLALHEIVEEVALRLKRNDTKGRTITIKVRYQDFSTSTRSVTLEDFTNDVGRIAEITMKSFTEHPRLLPIRLLGVAVSNLDVAVSEQFGQLTLEF